MPEHEGLGDISPGCSVRPIQPPQVSRNATHCNATHRRPPSHLLASANTPPSCRTVSAPPPSHLLASANTPSSCRTLSCAASRPASCIALSYSRLPTCCLRPRVSEELACGGGRGGEGRVYVCMFGWGGVNMWEGRRTRPPQTQGILRGGGKWVIPDGAEHTPCYAPAGPCP